MSENPEGKQDADEAIAEQTPMLGTITLRQTPAGVRMTLDESQLETLGEAVSILYAMACHATDGTEELAQGCDEDIGEIIRRYEGTED